MWITASQLPSKFLGYNLLTPVPTIQFRPYTHGEIKLLAEPTTSDADKYEVALAGIKTNFPRGKLYFDDLRYILVLRTLSTVDTQDFAVRFTDTDGTAKSQVFNLKDIEYEDVRAKSLPINFKLSDGTFARLTLPTIEHVDLLEAKGLDGDLVYKYTMIEDIDHVRDYIDGMSAADVIDLERVIQQYLVLEPVVHPKLSKVNPDDADEPVKEGRVVVSVDSVTPFRATHRDLASRVSFDA